MRSIHSAFLVIAAGVVALMPNVASAAPQILGVIATATPQTFTCADGTCEVELTTFCLQKERSSPTDGATYHINRPDDLTVVLRDEAGNERRISADGLIRLRSTRGIAAMTAQLDEDKLAELGAVSAAIEVSDRATLIPDPVEGDPEPLTAGEVAYATGPLRDLASEWLSGSGEQTAALRIVNHLINTTPLHGRMASADRRALWERTTGTPRDDVHADAGTRRALDIYDACAWRVEVGRYFSMRSCLEVKHDSALLEINTTYWKATAAGS